MNRREYVAFGGLVAATTAGCTVISGEINLTADEVVEHDRSLVLPFSHDDEDLLRIQLNKQFTGDEKRAYYPFSISTLQPAGNQIDSLRLKFRSQPHSSDFSPAGLALKEDHHAHMATLSQDGDDPSTTVLDLPDTASIGQGSVVVNLLLGGDHAEEPQQLWIRAEATLGSDSLLGTDYSATGDVTVRFP